MDPDSSASRGTLLTEIRTPAFLPKRPYQPGIGARRPDMMALAGLGLAIAAVVAGLLLEGGSITDISQLSAALIVFGGTLGAVMLNTPWPDLRSAVERARTIFFEQETASATTIDEIAAYGVKARHHGIVSLETDAIQADDAFLSKALTLAVDGTDLQSLREIMEREIRVEAERADSDAGVFEAAGGYAPTLGIIGAVIGLIQVMKYLDNLPRVGAGIAVAFVATVYGVGSANLLFLPLAQKIRFHSQQAIRSRQLMLEGVLAVAQEMHPRIIRLRLEAFTPRGAQVTRSSRPMREAEPHVASA